MEAVAMLVLAAGVIAALPAFGDAVREEAVNRIAIIAAGATVAAIALVGIVDCVLLEPLSLGHLRTFAIVMIVASVMLAARRLAQRSAATVGDAGSLAVLASASCATFGATLIKPGAPLADTILFALGAGLAVAIALPLFAALRERSDAAVVPAALRGTPVALLTAALVGLALAGVTGLGAR